MVEVKVGVNVGVLVRVIVVVGVTVRVVVGVADDGVWVRVGVGLLIGVFV